MPADAARATSGARGGELRRALRLAHRGDWRVAPENSPAALLAALRIPGCDGVEFDVRLSRDGEPVLVHDETLERVQGRPERVGESDAADLAAHGVATLSDALATLPIDAFLNVELKGPGHGRRTADVLRTGRGNAPARAIVCSFDPSSLTAMAALLPDWPRWLIANDLSPTTARTAVEVGCAAVSATWRAITPASVQRAAALGLDVAAWTVRSRVTAARLEALGVIALCVEGRALHLGGSAPRRTRPPA